MNEKDFRIGNYYKPTDGTSNFKQVTIEDLKAWSSGAIYGKPIKITSELLIKLGLNIDGDDWFFSDEHSFEIRLSNKQFFYAWDFRESSDKPIIYLHQLQNWYYLSTGNELIFKNKI